MAYTPTNWVTGDTVTATKMNKIENGIANAGGALICNVTNDGSNLVLDKTVQEIYDALISGTPAYIKYQYGVLGTDYTGDLILAPIVKIYNYNDTGLIRIIAIKGFMQHVSSSLDAAGPATVIFTAGGLNEYPTFYTSVYVGDTYENINIFVG